MHHFQTCAIYLLIKMGAGTFGLMFVLHIHVRVHVLQSLQYFVVAFLSLFMIGHKIPTYLLTPFFISLFKIII